VKRGRLDLRMDCDAGKTEFSAGANDVAGDLARFAISTFFISLHFSARGDRGQHRKLAIAPAVR